MLRKLLPHHFPPPCNRAVSTSQLRPQELSLQVQQYRVSQSFHGQQSEAIAPPWACVVPSAGPTWKCYIYNCLVSSSQWNYFMNALITCAWILLQIKQRGISSALSFHVSNFILEMSFPVGGWSCTAFNWSQHDTENISLS